MPIIEYDHTKSLENTNSPVITPELTYKPELILNYGRIDAVDAFFIIVLAAIIASIFYQKMGKNDESIQNEQIKKEQTIENEEKNARGSYSVSDLCADIILIPLGILTHIALTSITLITNIKGLFLEDKFKFSVIALLSIITIFLGIISFGIANS